MYKIVRSICVKSVVMQLFIFPVLNGQSVTKLHIDLDNFRGGTVSEVFDHIHFIPLETTKESLIGSVYQLQVTKKYFIISDNLSKTIFFFNKKGKFEFKLKAHPPDRYISNFFCDEKNGEILIQTEADVINIFDLRGNFLKRVKLSFGFWGFSLLNGNTIVYNANKPNKPTKRDTTSYDLHYATKYSQFFKKSLPYNPRIEICEYNTFTNPFSPQSGNDTVLYSLPYHYRVYALHDTGIYHIYNFLFPQKYSVPENFNTEDFTGKKEDYLYHHKENVNKIIGIEQVYKLGSSLLFTIRIRGAEARKYTYNLKTNDLISFDHVVGDSSSYFLPILKFTERMGAVYDGHIYSTMPSFVLDYANKYHPLKQYNPELEKYYNRHDKWSNPFIVEADLKDNL